MKRFLLIAGLVVVVGAFFVVKGIKTSTATATSNVPTAFFVTPHDGDVVDSPVHFEFGVTGMTVAPAGTMEPNTGHFHLLINLDELPDLTLPMPMTDQILHFGKGQTTADLDLPEGTYQFQLIMGDGAHVPHNPPVVSSPIIIEVKKP